MHCSNYSKCISVYVYNLIQFQQTKTINQKNVVFIIIVYYCIYYIILYKKENDFTFVQILINALKFTLSLQLFSNGTFHYNTSFPL